MAMSKRHLQQYLEGRADAMGTWRNVYYDSLPRKQRIVLALAHPLKVARYGAHQFAAWTTLPGDVWEDFQRDVLYVVRSVKVDRVEVYALAREFYYFGLPRGRASVARETFERARVQTWCRVRDSEAIAARDQIAQAL